MSRESSEWLKRFRLGLGIYSSIAHPVTTAGIAWQGAGEGPDWFVWLWADTAVHWTLTRVETRGENREKRRPGQGRSGEEEEAGREWLCLTKWSVFMICRHHHQDKLTEHPLPSKSYQFGWIICRRIQKWIRIVICQNRIKSNDQLCLQHCNVGLLSDCFKSSFNLNIYFGPRAVNCAG